MSKFFDYIKSKESEIGKGLKKLFTIKELREFEKREENG